MSDEEFTTRLDEIGQGVAEIEQRVKERLLKEAVRDRDNWQARAVEAERELRELKASIRYAETCSNQTLSKLYEKSMEAAKPLVDALEKIATEHFNDTPNYIVRQKCKQASAALDQWRKDHP